MNLSGALIYVLFCFVAKITLADTPDCMSGDKNCQHEVLKIREGVTSSAPGAVIPGPFNCDSPEATFDSLKKQHPLIQLRESIPVGSDSILERAKKFDPLNAIGVMAQGGGSSNANALASLILEGKAQVDATAQYKERHRDFVDDFDAHVAQYLAHSLSCQTFKKEDFFKYLEEEVPSQLFTEEQWEKVSTSSTPFGPSSYKMQWVEHRTIGNYDAREKFLKPKELAPLYKMVLEQLSTEKAIADAFAEQLIEFSKARLEKRDPKLTENLKKFVLEIGKKFKSGKLDEMSAAEKFLIGFFAQERPSASEKLWGSYLTAAYRRVLLDGELKIASHGNGSYSTQASSPKFILAGQGLIPPSLQDAFNNMSNVAAGNFHSLRNNPEDKTLFWKDPKNPLLIQLSQLTEPQRSTLRKWARERVFAVQEGKVEGGDPITQEALEHVLAALEGFYSKENKRVTLADYAELHTILTGQHEKITSHPESWNLSAHADSFADRLKKIHGLELTESARKNFLSLGAAERRVLLELSEKSGQNYTSELTNLLQDLNSTAVVELVNASQEARNIFYDQIKTDLALKGDLKTSTEVLVDSLKTNDASQNETTISKARAIRTKLIQELKRAVGEGKKGQAEAEALSHTINLSDETGLTKKQRAPLDATRQAVGESHYSVATTLKKLEAEEKVLRVIEEELKRSGRISSNEIDSLISELYPKGMNVPSHTRALLAQLLLPEHEIHLAMLRRLKRIAELRDSVMSEPKFRAVGDEFRTLLITPAPQSIEAKLKEYSPDAYAVFVLTQGDKIRHTLLKKVMLEPEAFSRLLQKMGRGEELNRIAGGEAELAERLTQLSAIELLKNSGQLNSVVGTDRILELAEHPLFATQMNAVIESLIHDGSTISLRGEGFQELADLDEKAREARAFQIRKIAGDLPEDITPEEAVSSLREYNQVGLQVRGELTHLLGQTSPTPEIDLSIADALNGLVDRQLRRLNLDFKQTEKNYVNAYREYEGFRTEHRRTGKEEWDAEVKQGVYDHKWTKNETVKWSTNKYYLDGFSQQLGDYRNKLTRDEKAAKNAEELVDIVSGKVTPSEKITNLDMLKSRLLEMQGAYLGDLQENLEKLNAEDLKKHEAELRRKLVDDYISRVALPKGMVESDVNEIRKKADAYLASIWQQQTHQLDEQSQLDARIAGFIEKNYKSELDKIGDPNAKDAQWMAYYNLVGKMLEDAKTSKAKVSLFVAGAQDQFGTLATSLLGNDPKRAVAFETLAKTMGKGDPHNPEKLRELSSGFVTEYMQSDLDKIVDPNEKAQQKEFLVTLLAKKLHSYYSTKSTDLPVASEENWNDKTYSSLLDQYASEAGDGLLAGYRLSEEELNNQLDKAFLQAHDTQSKSDEELSKALVKLSAIGVNFDGRSVVWDPASTIFLAHYPSKSVPNDYVKTMEERGWKVCNQFDFGGDPEMVEACKVRTFGKKDIHGKDEMHLAIATGDSQLMNALKTVNENNIPLQIDHPNYQVTSLDGKITLQDFIGTLFNQASHGKDTYLLPMGKNDAVYVRVDRNTGKMSYELRNTAALSKELKFCMEQVAYYRDTHQLATEAYGSFSTALSTVMDNGAEQPESHRMSWSWNSYAQMVETCNAYGAIDNGSGVTAHDFIEEEMGRMYHQLALARQANKNFENNLNVIEDVAWMTIATVATFGIVNPGLVALSNAMKVGLTAESIAGLSFGQKMIYIAAKSNTARRVLSTGSNLLERGLPLWQAATKSYGKKYLEGAIWGAAPLVPIYLSANVPIPFLGNKNQWEAWTEAEKRYHAGTFKPPQSKDFETEEEFKKAAKEWEELRARTDRNVNNIPDSLDRMGKIWILPDVADAFNSISGSGEFFGGMSFVHTLLPKVPGISYLSVFGGSMNSNLRDVLHGRKGFGEATKESAISTVGMAPGLVLMNNAQYLYRLPGMNVKLGLGKYGPSLGRSITTAGIHYSNTLIGPKLAESLGIMAPPPPSSDEELSTNEKVAHYTNEFISWKFAFDMSKTSELRNIARELGKVDKSEPYESFVKKYGEEDVKQAIEFMSKEELFATQDPELLNKAAKRVGKTSAQLKELLDISINGGNARFFKSLGVEHVPAVESTQPKSYIREAMNKLGVVGNFALQVVDGAKGWRHNYSGMEQNFQSLVLGAYQAAPEVAIRKKVADYMIQHPEMLVTLEAKRLNFSPTSENADVYLLESLANLTAGSKLANPFSQRPNAVVSGINIDGKFHNVYGAGFADYVRFRVLSGTAKERTLGQLLENYKAAWDRGDYNQILEQMQRQAAKTAMMK